MEELIKVVHLLILVLETVEAGLVELDFIILIWNSFNSILLVFMAQDAL
jgi:hypothetical protein